MASPDDAMREMARALPDRPMPATSKKSSGRGSVQPLDRCQKIGVAKLRLSIRDGRCCTLCAAQDDECKDPIVPSELIYWSYPPKNGKPHGLMCYYRYKIWFHKYVIKYTSPASLTKEMGQDEALHEAFWTMHRWVIEQYLKAASRDIKLTWMGSDEQIAKKQRLYFVDSSKVRIIEPEDIIVPIADYKHGDPMTNGKGHQVLTWRNEKCVRMPGPRMWRVKREREKVAAHTREIDDGSEMMTADQLESNHEEMELQLFGNSAVGQAVTLDDLLGVTVAAAAPSNAAEEKAADYTHAVGKSQGREQGSSSSGDLVLFGFAFNSVEVDTAAKPQPLADDTGVAQTPTKKRKGGRAKSKAQEPNAGGDPVVTPKKAIFLLQLRYK